MLMLSGFVMIFLVVLFLLLIGCVSYKNMVWGIYLVLMDICLLGMILIGGCKE